MAACPDGTDVSSSSMESTCLRISSLLRCAPICGHNMSSRVISSTECLAFLAAGAPDLSAAASEPADSFFLFALCTDGLLRFTRPINHAALQFRSTRVICHDGPRLQDPHGNGDLVRPLGSHFGVGRGLSAHLYRQGCSQDENYFA